jgi:hypothetical protein
LGDNANIPVGVPLPAALLAPCELKYTEVFVPNVKYP